MIAIMPFSFFFDYTREGDRLLISSSLRNEPKQTRAYTVPALCSLIITSLFLSSTARTSNVWRMHVTYSLFALENHIGELAKARRSLSRMPLP